MMLRVTTFALVLLSGAAASRGQTYYYYPQPYGGSPAYVQPYGRPMTYAPPAYIPPGVTYYHSGYSGYYAPYGQAYPGMMAPGYAYPQGGFGQRFGGGLGGFNNGGMNWAGAAMRIPGLIRTFSGGRR